MDPRLRMLGSFALLGTARRSPSFPESEFPSGTLIRELADAQGTSPESSARTLLRGAGVLFVCGRAGYQPSLGEETAQVPDVCPEETRDMLPEGLPVTDICGEIFQSGQIRLQWEALSHLEKRNMVLPHSLLVAALAMGRSTPALRPLLFRTAGERGLWLASRNPDWSMFAASSGSEPEMEVWEHGRPMQRQAFFLAVRQSDPVRARELFEKDMADMDASERNTLLGLFIHGLGAGDEDLLERLLRKDRSREVKKTAASLLSRLPGSRYLERMGERLSTCMAAFLPASGPSLFSGIRRVAAALAGRAPAKTEFIVPPETYDRSWAEDSVSEKSPSSQFGPRAGWLYQMAVAMPLSWWTERTGRTPEELLEISGRSEWKKPLQMAWGDAQLRCRDESWARAMLKVMKKGGVWPGISDGGLDSFSLADMLSREERDRVWTEQLSSSSLPELLQHIRSRQELDYQMSPDLAARAISAVKERLSSAKGRDYLFASVLDELAMVLPPDALEEARQMLSSLPDNPLNNGISDRFSAIALQRRTMGAYFS